MTTYLHPRPQTKRTLSDLRTSAVSSWNLESTRRWSWRHCPQYQFRGRLASWHTVNLPMPSSDHVDLYVRTEEWHATSKVVLLTRRHWCGPSVSEKISQAEQSSEASRRSILPRWDLSVPSFCCTSVICLTLFITGPPTHSVGGQTSNGRWCLSSSVTRRICNVTHQGQYARWASSVTPVKATPCWTLFTPH